MAPLRTVLTTTALLALAAGHPLSGTSTSVAPSTTTIELPTSTGSASLAHENTILPSTYRGTSTQLIAGTSTPSPFVGTGTINVVLGSDARQIGCLDDNMRVIPVPPNTAQPINPRDGLSSGAALPDPTPTIVGSSPSYAQATITATPLQSSAAGPAQGGDSASSSIVGDAGAAGGLAFANPITVLVSTTTGSSMARHTSLQTSARFSHDASASANAAASVSIALGPGPVATPSGGHNTCATFTGVQAQATGAVVLKTLAGECSVSGSGEAPALACGSAKTKSRISGQDSFYVGTSPLGSMAVLCEGSRGACSYATNSTIGSVPVAIHGGAADNKHAMRLTWTAVGSAEL